MSHDCGGVCLVSVALELSLWQPTSPIGTITTILTFRSVDLHNRNSSWDLHNRNSGGSNFSLNFEEATEQFVKKRMSNILGTLQENFPTWTKTTNDKCSGGRKDLESSGTLRSNSSEASSGKILDLKGKGDMNDNVDTDFQANLGIMESKPIPAAFIPTWWPQPGPGSI
ncbi:Jupiter microtubule associated homolog 1 [Lemmus lemmus]